LHGTPIREACRASHDTHTKPVGLGDQSAGELFNVCVGGVRGFSQRGAVVTQFVQQGFGTDATCKEARAPEPTAWVDYNRRTSALRKSEGRGVSRRASAKNHNVNVFSELADNHLTESTL
jgi:hypothetical protein